MYYSATGKFIKKEVTNYLGLNRKLSKNAGKCGKRVKESFKDTSNKVIENMEETGNDRIITEEQEEEEVAKVEVIEEEVIKKEVIEEDNKEESVENEVTNQPQVEEEASHLEKKLEDLLDASANSIDDKETRERVEEANKMTLDNFKKAQEFLGLGGGVSNVALILIILLLIFIMID